MQHHFQGGEDGTKVLSDPSSINIFTPDASAMSGRMLFCIYIVVSLKNISMEWSWHNRLENGGFAGEKEDT